MSTALRHVSAPASRALLENYELRVSRAAPHEPLRCVSSCVVRANRTMIDRLAREALGDAQRRHGGAIEVAVTDGSGAPVMALSGGVLGSPEVVLVSRNPTKKNPMPPAETARPELAANSPRKRPLGSPPRAAGSPLQVRNEAISVTS